MSSYDGGYAHGGERRQGNRKIGNKSKGKGGEKGADGKVRDFADVRKRDDEEPAARSEGKGGGGYQGYGGKDRGRGHEGGGGGYNRDRGSSDYQDYDGDYAGKHGDRGDRGNRLTNGGAQGSERPSGVMAAGPVTRTDSHTSAATAKPEPGSAAELLQEAMQCLNANDISGFSKALVKNWRAEHARQVRNDPLVRDMLARLSAHLHQPDANVSKKDLADIAMSLGKLQISNPTAQEVLKRVGDLAKHRAEQLTPHDMARIVWGLASLHVRNESMMSVIAAEVVNKISGFDQRQLSNTAWAFAKCGLWNEQLVDTIANECLQKIETFTAQSLSHISWAMAQWGTRNDSLMAALGAEVRKKVEDFTPASLSMTTWSFASLLVHDVAMMEAISKEAVEQMSKFKTDDLALLAWAFANLRQQDNQLFSAMAEKIKSNVKAAPGTTAPPELANIAWAFSKHNVPHEGLMAVIASEATIHIHSFKAAEVAMLIWAVAVAGLQNSPLMAEIGTSVSRKIDKYSAPQLSHIAWAFGALSMRHTEFLQTLSKYVLENFQAFKVQGLSSIVWCYAMVGFRDQELLMRVAPELARHVKELRPIAMARCVWAYKTLMLNCPDLMREIAGEALRKVADFPTKALVKLIDSVYVSPAAMSSCQNLILSLEERTGSMVDLLKRTWPNAEALKNASVEEYREELTALGLADVGLVGTPLLLRQLEIDLPSFKFIQSCRAREWLKDETRPQAEGECPEFAAALAELTASEDRQLTEWVVRTPTETGDAAGSASGSTEGTAKPESESLFKAVELSGRSGAKELIFVVLSKLAERICEWLEAEAGDVEACAAVEGTVQVLSTLVPCLSCVGALQQFNVLFPKVTLEFAEQVGAIRD